MESGRGFDFLWSGNKRCMAIRGFMDFSSSLWKSSYFVKASGDRPLGTVLDEQLVRDAVLRYSRYET